ncbi:Squalene/phytoene synthase [Parasponia andersonii]|uniref:Squalene/phytoene synthase n=1 Tax=Parasponia andersonii TaxID=3476 RepID=A0A2P5A807_PARAD|nr:Squalene/phytoene synthase [Parasponia andersonii]
MQMTGVRLISYSSMHSAAFLKRPEPYSWKKKLFTRSNTSFMSCKYQTRSPLSMQSSKPETQHHDSLLKSLLLQHGVVTDHDDSSSTKSTSEEHFVKVQKALRKPSTQRTKMRLIDSIQRLGVGHHFEEIKQILEGFSDLNSSEDNLFDTALRFRLLRHNGLPTSSDVFDQFINKEGEFKESLSQDTCGMLSLYEASYLGAKGEDKLHKAMEFTRSHLKQSMSSVSPELQTQVAKALELPRHLRMATLEARNYIDEYSQESNHNSALLALAKLEFNELQSLHKRELTEIIRWWKQLGLVDKLGFGRDRPCECFLWTVGILPEASYSSIRVELAKTISILLVIDDIYDTYGSLDELVLFNEAIRRWELGAMDMLLEYMKICYMALYNTTNEIGYRVLKEHGWCITEHLKRTWIDIFEAFLTEAEWFNKKHTPTLEPYLTNGVTSGGSYMALVHSFFLIGHDLTDETISLMQPYPELFSCSGKILRLWDDLGTAKEEQERGDVASSIECYMREKNIEFEDEARKHIRELIRSLWMELNGELRASSALPRSITKACIDLARTAQVIYDQSFFNVEDHVQSLFFRPYN